MRARFVGYPDASCTDCCIVLYWSSRIVNEVVREAKEACIVRWVRDLMIGEGWRRCQKQKPGRGMNEVKHVLKDIAWRRVIENVGAWKLEGACPKLEVLGRLMDCECKKRCVDIGYKRQRGMLV